MLSEPAADPAPIFFDHFDPADVKPRQHVGRGRDVQWLREILARYLQTAELDAGKALCLVGEKGTGKSILTRTVLDDLRGRFSANTLFLVVDCRSCHDRRGVISAICNEIVRELHSLMRASAEVPAPLVAASQMLRALSTLGQVSVRSAHAQVLQYQDAVRMGSRKLLGSLKRNFGLSLELTEVQIRSLMGTVRFDDLGLSDALIALCRDLRVTGYNVVLFLDNLDELRHEYREASIRDALRAEIEGILALREAPIALVLNVRTYFASVVPRERWNTRMVAGLSTAEMLDALDKRLCHERGEVQVAVTAARPLVERFATIATTPLAFLRQIKFLFEEGCLAEDRVDDGLHEYLKTQYPNIGFETLERIVQAFPAPDAVLDEAAVKAACDGSDALFEVIQDRQVVMPEDFWNPIRFILDPELHCLHPSHGLFTR